MAERGDGGSGEFAFTPEQQQLRAAVRKFCADTNDEAAVRRLMEAEGFVVNPEEWWHFDFRDWKNYAIGNVAFDRIRG